MTSSAAADQPTPRGHLTMARRKLNPLIKFAGIFLLLIGAFFGGRALLNTDFGRKIAPTGKSGAAAANVVSDLGGKKAINVCINTWGGYAGGAYFNQGFEASEQSLFFKEYGLPVNMILIDDFDNSRNAWKTDQCQVLWQTADAFPAEAEALAEFQPKIFMQWDWSYGGDRIVATRDIKSVKDLKGQKVAFVQGSPSHSLLLTALEAQGMTQNDIIAVTVASPDKAVEPFKSNDVKAAVTWAPIDEDAIRSVPGAHVLMSTREAANVVPDIFFVKQSFLDSNREQLGALMAGWLRGNAAVKNDPTAKAQAIKILASGFNLPEADIEKAIDNARLVTYGDNVNFFNLKGNYTGTTGQYLYESMTRKFRASGVIKNDPPGWTRVIDLSVLRDAETVMAGMSDQAAEGALRFPKASAQVASAEALSSRPVAVQFPSGQDVLTEDAKYAIDNEVVPIVKKMTGAYMRVEGNTDNTGSDAVNVPLSERRAAAAINYLVTKYGYDRNRFIARGNGSKKPVEGCTDNSTPECRAHNRRTEFQVVSKK
jgi:NitT/TauT family transport system substrate-binding protein